MNVAWLSGEGIEGQENGFQWREASATDWQGSIPSETTSSTLSARLSGLKAETAYIYRAYSGEEYGEEIMFTTGKAIPLENGSFEYWQKPKKIWLVYGEGQEMYWDSGNHGSSTLNKNVTEPTEETTASEISTTPETTETTSENPVQPTKYGDIDCDDIITATDIVLLNKYILSNTEYDLKPVAKANADCNIDGVIDLKDSNMLIGVVIGTFSESDLGKAVN